MLERSPSPECTEDGDYGGETVPKHGCRSTDADLDLLFENLSIAGTKPGVLSLVPKFSDNYVPESSRDNFPIVLKLLQKQSYIGLRYDQLLEVCKSVFDSITRDGRISRKETRTQSKSNLWFQHRAGRVTSSRMKAVCHTDSTNPDQSLVKSI